MAKKLGGRVWVKGSPFVEILKGVTDRTAIHMIARGHETSVKRLKPALKRNAPPRVISRKYKKKRTVGSSGRKPFAKLKNSNAWGTGRDKTHRRKNVGAWIGSKHPFAATAIWNNYGTKNRKYTGAWKRGKSTGRIKGTRFIQKTHAANKSRLVALGHRDIQDMAVKRLVTVSRGISRRSRSLI